MGALESQFFAYCQMRRLQTVRSGEISAVLKLTSKQERDLFYRLTNDGWIVRLRRGLFLVPARLPVGGKWMPDAGLVFAKLMEDCGGRYQLCGANAFNRWGFDDQVPTRYYAYNNRFPANGSSLVCLSICLRLRMNAWGQPLRQRQPPERHSSTRPLPEC